jgi:hypothetical protein
MALRLSSLLLLLLSAGIFPFLRTMYLIRRIEKPCWIPLARSSVMLAQRFVKRVARLINYNWNWYDMWHERDSRFASALATLYAVLTSHHALDRRLSVLGAYCGFSGGCVVVVNRCRRVERACWAVLAARLISCDRNWYDAIRWAHVWRTVTPLHRGVLRVYVVRCGQSLPCTSLGVPASCAAGAARVCLCFLH